VNGSGSLSPAAVLFESVEEIYKRVFKELRPSARRPGAMPEMHVQFCRFANANSTVRMQDGRIDVRISDVLAHAPAQVLEALAYILFSKLLRKPLPRVYLYRYRRFLNRRDTREELHRVRKERGRKQICEPQGEHFHLEEVFEELNFRFFHGLMARPQIGWSLKRSRTMLGHYDPSHHAIVISRILDSPGLRRALEYVVYHEMLHLRHPVEHRGLRRCVHTPEFQRAEREFPQLEEAKRLLKTI
jgi:hypothetical protein